MQTVNVSGQKLIQLLLTANIAGLVLSGALDQQQVTIEFTQNSTGGWTVSSTQIPALQQPNPAANATSSQTVQYTAATNTWAAVPGTAVGGAPQIVFQQNGSLGFAIFNSAAAVTMVPAGAPAGIYRITLFGVVTTTFTTGTAFVFTFGYTDDDQAETVVYTGAALTAGTKIPPVSSTVSNSITIRSTGVAAITYTPSGTGSAFAAGVMAVGIVVERLA